MNQEPEIRHLWTDEEVAAMKAKGQIVEDSSVPDSPDGKCVDCGKTLAEHEAVICDACLPF